MRTISLVLFQLLACCLIAQTVDSTIIRQVDSLIQVSRNLKEKGDFVQALEVNAAAEKRALEKVGKQSTAYGNCAFNRGSVNYFKGDFPEAERWFLEGKAIREQTLGKEHLDYVTNLIFLAIVYWNMSNYEKAEPLFLEARDIREKMLGNEHSDYASCLNNLAVLYCNMGKYEKAEPLYLEAKSICEKVLNKEHPNYATNLNNLANLYYRLGNYEKVELLYLEAKYIREKVLGKEHPDYAISLSNLAVLYVDMGNYEKAEPLHLEAKYIREKVLGKEDPDYASSLNNLAILYYHLGNYEKAEALYLEAKDIKEKVLGVEHPNYTSSLNNLANLFDNLGKYEKAEPLYLEAKAIDEKVLGKEHPDYIQDLTNLAGLYERQSRFKDAEPLLEEGLKRTQKKLVNATTFLSEQELAKYAVTFQKRGDNLSAYLLARYANDITLGILPTLAYDHALFYKGFLLTAASRLNAPVLASPETVDINLLLKGYRRRLSAEYTKPIAERKDIADLEEKANLAEKDLARSVAGYADALRAVKWEDVKAGLKPSEAAIEFVHFKINFPAPNDSIMYAALFIKPGSESPQFIPLFEEKELDHLLQTDNERKADYVNELYTWANRGLIQTGSEQKSLYDLIWKNIDAAGLQDVKTVYYSPSGVLHRINLGTIAVDDETILSDRYNLVTLNSTRQLVIPAAVITQTNDVLLVGGVNFEVDTTNTTFEEQPLLTSRSAADAWTASGTRGGNWSYLKWTEKEVERIATTLSTGGFKTAQLTGSKATEEAIKAIGRDASSPRVLHIATHGFFFPDPEVNIQKEGLGEMEPVFKSSDNPMIRSGLILAGGNYAWQKGHAPLPDKEDGILTAYEISQMNLSHTELVVLSACETGLGDIQGNEGVYGLQRAFKIAGAKYLIMSLWQVPDRETMEFMTAFYKNWLESNMTIPEAFRKTQREMRDRFFNPYSWAGFVLVE